jgi:hypothetical protein
MFNPSARGKLLVCRRAFILLDYIITNDSVSARRGKGKRCLRNNPLLVTTSLTRLAIRFFYLIVLYMLKANRNVLIQAKFITANRKNMLFNASIFHGHVK